MDGLRDLELERAAEEPEIVREHLGQQHGGRANRQARPDERRARASAPQRNAGDEHDEQQAAGLQDEVQGVGERLGELARIQDRRDEREDDGRHEADREHEAQELGETDQDTADPRVVSDAAGRDAHCDREGEPDAEERGSAAAARASSSAAAPR